MQEKQKLKEQRRRLWRRSHQQGRQKKWGKKEVELFPPALLPSWLVTLGKKEELFCSGFFFFLFLSLSLAFFPPLRPESKWIARFFFWSRSEEEKREKEKDPNRKIHLGRTHLGLINHDEEAAPSSYFSSSSCFSSSSFKGQRMEERFFGRSGHKNTKSGSFLSFSSSSVVVFTV